MPLNEQRDVDLGDDSESDWSTSGDEQVVSACLAGTAISVTYKGSDLSGTVGKKASTAPDDFVPIVLPASASGPVRGIWCRVVGSSSDDVEPMSRGDCRRLMTDLISKPPKTGLPSATDVDACVAVFGTVYPLQLSVDPTSATAVSDASSARRTIQFKCGKQTVVGTAIPFSNGARDDGIVAVCAGTATLESRDVYWVVQDVNAKWIPVTVTDCRKLMKGVLGHAISSDGPSPQDASDCMKACGVTCPGQLYDALHRNSKAKAKRVVHPTVADGRKRVAPAASASPARPVKIAKSAGVATAPVSSVPPPTVTLTFSGTAVSMQALLAKHVASVSTAD